MDRSRSPGASAGSTSRAGSASSTPDLSRGTPGQSQSGTPHPPIASQQVSRGEGLSQGSQAVGTKARHTADSLTQGIKEAAQTTTRAVKAQASEFTADVGHELNRVLEQQKARGADAMRGVARAINAAAAEMQGQAPFMAQYVRDAAGKVEGLSESIEGRNVNNLVRAASELARSQPMLFLGGAVAAGFVLSRFLKSSAKEDQRDHSSAPDLSPM
jgi:hypothetical protein